MGTHESKNKARNLHKLIHSSKRAHKLQSWCLLLISHYTQVLTYRVGHLLDFVDGDFFLLKLSDHALLLWGQKYEQGFSSLLISAHRKQRFIKRTAPNSCLLKESFGQWRTTHHFPLAPNAFYQWTCVRCSAGWLNDLNILYREKCNADNDDKCLL